MSRDGIIEGMARGLWLTSFADWVEELPKAQRKARGVPINLSGFVWDDVAPATPRAAENAARELAELYETENGESLDAIEQRARNAQGSDIDDELFGHYLAMMALGHGVSWFDDHAKFDLKEPMFEVHFDGEFFDWSGRVMRSNPPRLSGDRGYLVGDRVTVKFPKRPAWEGTVVLVERASGLPGRVEGYVVADSQGREHHVRGRMLTPTRNPAGLTKKGERMYRHIESAYRKVGNIRAKEIAARTTYARAKTTPGIRKANPPFVLPVPGQRIRSWDHGDGRLVKICEEGRNGEYTADIELPTGERVSVPLTRTEYDLSPRKALERRTGFSRHEQYIGLPKPERTAKGTPMELDDTTLAPRGNGAKRRRAT